MFIGLNLQLILPLNLALSLRKTERKIQRKNWRKIKAKWKWTRCCRRLISNLITRQNPIVIRHTKCFHHWYAVLRACGCTLTPLHWPSHP